MTSCMNAASCAARFVFPWGIVLSLDAGPQKHLYFLEGSQCLELPREVPRKSECVREERRLIAVTPGSGRAGLPSL